MYQTMRALYLHGDGYAEEIDVRPGEISRIVGSAPRGFPVGGGLYIYYSPAAQREGQPRECMTTVQSAAGRTRARFYGKTLLCHIDRRGALRNIQPADIAIARWLVRVTGNQEGYEC